MDVNMIYRDGERHRYSRAFVYKCCKFIKNHCGELNSAVTWAYTKCKKVLTDQN